LAADRLAAVGLAVGEPAGRGLAVALAVDEV
jgi:hypothetical protein